MEQTEQARTCRGVGLSCPALLLSAMALVLAALVMFVAPAAHAQESEHVRGDFVLQVVTLNLPPYGYDDSQGYPAGLNVDCAAAIAGKMGVKVNNRLAPLRRSIDFLEQGQADLCILFPNPMVKRVARNAGFILPMRTVVFGGPGSSLALDDLEGLELAHVRGANYDDRISQNPHITKNYTNDYAQGLKMLQAGYVDGVVGPELGILYTAKALGVSRSELGEPLVLSTAEGTVFVSRKSIHFSAIQQAVTELLELGIFQQIQSRYSN